MNRALAELLEKRVFFTISAATPSETAAPEAAAAVPTAPLHLTARPWKAINVSPTAYLDEVEQIARAMAKYQDASGKIIDPYEKIEIQYSTAYFAFSVGVLLSAGRASDLLAKGSVAMDSATEVFSRGVDAIPNGAGEFFLAPLTKALALYQPRVSATTMSRWRSRMSVPLSEVLRGDDHNWRTFAMAGEWESNQVGARPRNGG